MNGLREAISLRRRSHPDLIARINAYTTAAPTLEDVHDHLLLATAALHSGDEDTAAREIKFARSLMRAAVEEMRA